jgi:tetratricopeptide (TPR) repeat protein
MRVVLSALLLSAPLLGAVGAPPARAQHEGHEHHAGAEAPAGETMVGRVAFANTCSADVQDELMRGIAMLHSFWYSAGERTFRAVLDKDPHCAIAAWGIASLMMDNPLAGIGSNSAEAPKGLAALAQARAIGAGSERERDYIEAVGAYYQDFATRPERARQASRAAAYEALAAKYPDDDEAQIFSALYIAGTQSQSDQSFSAYRKAVAILTPELARHPDHPGIAHYLIHCFDAPPIAAQGLPAALAYSRIAPDAPHAQHMPSHIFTRVGAWEQSAASNARAFAAALPGHEFSEAQHASDYMVYADLQLARDRAAQQAMEAAFAVTVPPPVPPATFYARAAIPARLLVERADWQGAARLPTPAPGQPYGADALTLFARAIGRARSGDADGAAQDADALRAVQQRLADAGNAYWANEVGTQAITAGAWAAFGRGDTATALAAMRDAADREDRIEKHIVTPGRILPARELLGDMLLAAGQPAAALAAYETSFTRDPNRFRGLYGAARAADAAGDHDKAATYARKLLTLAKDADSDRPELDWARAHA